MTQGPICPKVVRLTPSSINSLFSVISMLKTSFFMESSSQIICLTATVNVFANICHHMHGVHVLHCGDDPRATYV